jgi:hypothetical protein
LNGVWTIAAIGFLSALAALRHLDFSWPIVPRADFHRGAAVFATWACGVAWSTRYKNPVFWETVEFRADVHHDPLYYVSMANSMRSYGVPSTALDGVPYTPYHYGSAWLNSQWAYLADKDVLEFYSLGPSVVAIPLFFCALLLLRGRDRKRKSETPLAARRLGRMACFSRCDDWRNPDVGSRRIGHLESSRDDFRVVRHWSSGISPCHLDDHRLLAAPENIISLQRHRFSVSFRAGDARRNRNSQGFDNAAAACRRPWPRCAWQVVSRQVIVLATLLCIVASGVAYKLVSVAAQNQGIVPFAYMRYYANPAWWPYFVLAHLFWSWVYIYLRLREESVKTIGDIRQAALQGRITDVVVVAIVALAGWAAGEVLDIHGGSAVYFSDVQRWLSLALLIGALPRWLAQRSEAPARRFTFGGIRVSRLWLFALALPLVSL